MATEVFISWSGDLSKRLGEALWKWLPGVLQHVKPYFTPDDIEKGAKWNSDIVRKLEQADIGLICLTQDNTDKAWILFEAGALSKSVEKSRVCPILFNLDPTDLTGPFASFQATRFNRDDIKRLVETINNVADEDKLEPQTLENVFEVWWPKLEKKVSEILDSHTEDNPKARRSDRDILEEMLALTRMRVSRPSWSPRMRKRAVMEIIEELGEFASTVLREGHPDTFHSLMSRLHRPLKRLCREAGVSEIYQDFHKQQYVNFMRSIEDQSEEAEQDTGDDK